jgi:hypothetical protein
LFARGNSAGRANLRMKVSSVNNISNMSSRNGIWCGKRKASQRQLCMLERRVMDNATLGFNWDCIGEAVVAKDVVSKIKKQFDKTVDRRFTIIILVDKFIGYFAKSRRGRLCSIMSVKDGRRCKTGS